MLCFNKEFVMIRLILFCYDDIDSYDFFILDNVIYCDWQSFYEVTDVTMSLCK